jgi:beta-phosphoglucomutase
MNKYQGVIFDLDGVICFTDHYHYLAWKSLADSLGIEFDEKKNDRLRGVSRMESLEIVLEGYKGAVLSNEEKAALAEKKNGLYRELLQTMTPDDLSDEVRETLNALRARGIKLAIGSSSKNTPLILERIGLADFFDAVSDGNNIQRSKPDPQVFTMAAGMLKLKPSQCLVVEDAAAGLQAAAAGGFDSAALGPAAASGKATYSLKSFRELLEIA